MGLAGAVDEPAVGGMAGDEQRINGAGTAQRDGGGVGGVFDILGAAGGGEEDQEGNRDGAADDVHGGTASWAKPTGGEARAAWGVTILLPDQRGWGKPNPESGGRKLLLHKNRPLAICPPRCRNRPAAARRGTALSPNTESVRLCCAPGLRETGAARPPGWNAYSPGPAVTGSAAPGGLRSGAVSDRGSGLAPGPRGITVGTMNTER